MAPVSVLLSHVMLSDWFCCCAVLQKFKIQLLYLLLGSLLYSCASCSVRSSCDLMYLHEVNSDLALKKATCFQRSDIYLII